MAERLKDRVAIVTGAARGNGEGIATAMAKEGAVVILWDVLDLVETTARKIDPSGSRAVPMIVDIADGDQVNVAAKSIIERYGKVDILVNNAAIAFFMPFLEVTDALRDRMFDVNLKGPWNCTKAVIPAMVNQKYGKIINVASVTGARVSAPGLTAYSATKGGVCGFTRALALEFAGSGINVNAILPGYVDTPMLRGAAADIGIPEDDLVQMLSKSVPMKRLCTISEMGDLAVFLASEESAYITGQEIVIDGGNIIQEEKFQE
jgi:NAD(P)-dependent dehydrogenase (short-subunit alcohol dehydrogenase family)